MKKLFAWTALALLLIGSPAFAGSYISAEIGYYEGDRIASTDTAVPTRPGAAYVWQGGAWVYPLATAQAEQIATLNTAYNAALQAPVSFTTAGGVTKTFKTDQVSVNYLMSMQLAFQQAGAVPSGFIWLAADGTQAPFTYADILGLSHAIGVAGLAQWQHLQTQISAVNAATTVAAVQAVGW